MHIAEILAKKGTDVVTVRPDDTIGHAADVLAERRFGALVVSAGDGRIDGILSERDLVRGLSQFGDEVRSQTVSTLMTSPVKTCGSGDTIEQLMSQMTEHRIRHLPVASDGRLVGMISIGDLVQAIIADQQEAIEQLESYISG